jgi:hypothetical protein
LLDCLALAAQGQRRWSEQLDYAEQLLQERIWIVGPRTETAAEALIQIALILDELGRTHDALVVELAAHALMEETAGVGSLLTARTWAEIARLRATLHDNAGARSAIDQASAIVLRDTVEDDASRENVMRARAEVLGALGDAKGAVASLGTLAADVARLHPGTIDDFAATVTYTQALQDVDRCADALPLLDAAIARGTSFAPAQRLVLVNVKANCQLLLDRPKDAVRDLGDAWVKFDGSTMAPSDRAMIVYTLAEAYDGAGDHAHALELGRKARADIVATESLADYLPSIDGLIKRNGGRPPPHASSSSSPHR